MQQPRTRATRSVLQARITLFHLRTATHSPTLPLTRFTPLAHHTRLLLSSTLPATQLTRLLDPNSNDMRSWRGFRRKERRNKKAARDLKMDKIGRDNMRFLARIEKVRPWVSSRAEWKRHWHTHLRRSHHMTAPFDPEMAATAMAGVNRAARKGPAPTTPTWQPRCATASYDQFTGRRTPLQGITAMRSLIRSPPATTESGATGPLGGVVRAATALAGGGTGSVQLNVAGNPSLNGLIQGARRGGDLIFR